MASRFDQSNVSGTTVAIASAILFVGIAAVIWFAIPGLDAKHRFVAPSGMVAIELGEQCREAGCTRIAISEISAVDGSKTRRGCRFELAETRPVLLNAYPLWRDDERVVDIVYADADGLGGRFTLEFARDCTLTE